MFLRVKEYDIKEYERLTPLLPHSRKVYNDFYTNLLKFVVVLGDQMVANTDFVEEHSEQVSPGCCHLTLTKLGKKFLFLPEITHLGVIVCENQLRTLSQSENG
jgi:hypothetical protein